MNQLYKTIIYRNYIINILKLYFLIKISVIKYLINTNNIFINY